MACAAMLLAAFAPLILLKHAPVIPGTSTSREADGVTAGGAAARRRGTSGPPPAAPGRPGRAGGKLAALAATRSTRPSTGPCGGRWARAVGRAPAVATTLRPPGQGVPAGGPAALPAGRTRAPGARRVDGPAGAAGDRPAPPDQPAAQAAGPAVGNAAPGRSAPRRTSAPGHRRAGSGVLRAAADRAAATAADPHPHPGRPRSAGPVSGAPPGPGPARRVGGVAGGNPPVPRPARPAGPSGDRRRRRGRWWCPVTRTSVLAGDARSRGLFRGRRSRAVAAARYAAAAVVLVLLLLFQCGAWSSGCVLLVVVFGATADTGTGRQPLAVGRRQTPVVGTGSGPGSSTSSRSTHRPDDLTPTVVDGTRAERRAAARVWNAYRDWPDGVDGLYWLESRPGLPAVAYHAGAGEDPYLSAAFRVDGPIQGLHGDAFVDPGAGGVRAAAGRVGRRRETGLRHPGADPGDPGGLRAARDVAAGPAGPRRPAGPAGRLHRAAG